MSARNAEKNLPNPIMKKLHILLIKISVLVSLAFLFAGCLETRDPYKWDIRNPYESVNWTKHGHYKANLHTHTTISDGRLNPHEVVDKYHELGYDILAITDHNIVSYPWTSFTAFEASDLSLYLMKEEPDEMPENLIFEDRDPITLNMTDIQGNELSMHHHTGSFFNDHDGTKTEEGSLDSIDTKNGLAILFHPGRYNVIDRNPKYSYVSLEWYVDLYHRYDHLVGQEVYNNGDRYPKDRILWDSILMITMPSRPVWGYSNDDMHRLINLGHNWNVFILPELTHKWVMQGLKMGLSYFVYSPIGHDGNPVIEKINVDRKSGTIEISARDYDSINWINGGIVKSRGEKINLNELKENVPYIRAELYGKDRTVTGTQPFGIRKL